MRFRTLLALLIPLACAALFVRLGVWQLSRHRERAALNADLAAQLDRPPRPFDLVLADSANGSWARVSLSGRFRYDLEQIQAGRSSEGSPGVHLLTPLERPGTDTLVLVTRGWVYSPDAASAELPRWREGDSVAITGYLLRLPEDGPPAPADSSKPLRVLTRQAVAARFGAPVAPFYVVMTSDSLARADSVPRRLPLPTIDGGPHRSYAIQWFSFALIAIVGGVLLYRRSIELAGPIR